MIIEPRLDYANMYSFSVLLVLVTHKDIPSASCKLHEDVRSGIDITVDNNIRRQHKRLTPKESNALSADIPFVVFVI